MEYLIRPIVSWCRHLPTVSRRQWRRCLAAALALTLATDCLALAASPAAAATQQRPAHQTAASVDKPCLAAEHAAAEKPGQLFQHNATCALHCGMGVALPSAEPLTLEQFFKEPPPTGNSARRPTVIAEGLLRPPIRLT